MSDYADPQQCSLCGRIGTRGFTGAVCTATRACRRRRAPWVAAFDRGRAKPKLAKVVPINSAARRG